MPSRCSLITDYQSRDSMNILKEKGSTLSRLDNNLNTPVKNVEKNMALKEKDKEADFIPFDDDSGNEKLKSESFKIGEAKFSPYSNKSKKNRNKQKKIKEKKEKIKSSPISNNKPKQVKVFYDYLRDISIIEKESASNSFPLKEISKNQTNISTRKTKENGLLNYNNNNRDGNLSGKDKGKRKSERFIKRNSNWAQVMDEDDKEEEEVLMQQFDWLDEDCVPAIDKINFIQDDSSEEFSTSMDEGILEDNINHSEWKDASQSELDQAFTFLNLHRNHLSDGLGSTSSSYEVLTGSSSELSDTDESDAYYTEDSDESTYIKNNSSENEGSFSVNTNSPRFLDNVSSAEVEAEEIDELEMHAFGMKEAKLLKWMQATDLDELENIQESSRGLKARLKRLQKSNKGGENIKNGLEPRRVRGGKKNKENRYSIIRENGLAESVNGDNLTEFNELNRELKRFIRDSELQEYDLVPMPHKVRKYAHELAQLYSLKSKSRGRGMERFIVLYKTKHTAWANPKPNQVRNVIAAAMRYQTSPQFRKDLGKLHKVRHVEAQKNKKKKNANRQKQGKDSEASSFRSARIIPGTVVGDAAGPIHESNVGNVLLRKLGWTPGSGLGSTSSGIVDPVMAVVRRKNAGLGHEDRKEDH